MAEGAVVGLLLAAGAGRRIGTPKALLRDRAGSSLLDRALRSLVDGGCHEVTVVVGAAAKQAIDLLTGLGWSDDPRVHVTMADDWDEGMGASLRAGLSRLATEATVVVVTLVDLPDVGDAVVRRVVERVGTSPEALGRATYGGTPGHPVLLGRDHWPGVISSAHGDSGARDYLRAHHLTTVECSDLATGRDVDVPDQL